MTRTITAMYDSRSEAEEARTRLSSANIDASQVRIIDKEMSASDSSGSAESSGGFWASLKDAFMPDDDRHAYGEGIQRGGFMLCAQVEEDQADRAVSLLDETNSVDFDRRQDEWRSEGWQGSYSGAGQFREQRTGDRSQTVAEENFPIVEEELQIGKREVNRGGARVRSYVREVPVHEQVSLREEHVSVERRPVDRTLGAADLKDGDLLRDRQIDMTETSEEAVVAKEAKVREEVVVKKTAEERIENIDDTVRHTEVEIDEGGRGSDDRSAFGSFGGQGSGTTGGSGESRTDFERTDRDRSGF